MGTPDLGPQIRDARKNVKLLSERVLRSDVLLDLGANIGEISIHCAPLVRRVIAVEANPTTFGVLEERLDQAGVKNVTAVNAVVAPEHERNYYVSNPSFCGTGITARRSPRLRRENYYSVVKSISWATLMGFSPTVVKMDIQGQEFDCLTKPVAGSVRLIVVEFHSLTTKLDAAQAILRKLGKVGFTYDPKAILSFSKMWALATVILERK